MRQGLATPGQIPRGHLLLPNVRCLQIKRLRGIHQTGQHHGRPVCQCSGILGRPAEFGIERMLYLWIGEKQDKHPQRQFRSSGPVGTKWNDDVFIFGLNAVLDVALKESRQAYFMSNRDFIVVMCLSLEVRNDSMMDARARLEPAASGISDARSISCCNLAVASSILPSAI